MNKIQTDLNARNILTFEIWDIQNQNDATMLIINKLNLCKMQLCMKQHPIGSEMIT